MNNVELARTLSWRENALFEEREKNQKVSQLVIVNIHLVPTLVHFAKPIANCKRSDTVCGDGFFLGREVAYVNIRCCIELHPLRNIEYPTHLKNGFFSHSLKFPRCSTFVPKHPLQTKQETIRLSFSYANLFRFIR